MKIPRKILKIFLVLELLLVFGFAGIIILALISDFKPEFSINMVNTEQMIMNSDYLPSEWKWIYDNSAPSNRTVIAAYDPSTTTTTVIDLFLLSPNIQSVDVECINLEFENSDHNPVRIKMKLQN
jgi:hypothetical protein